MNGRSFLDETDTRIIELLQEDGRCPNTRIARELGISESTVRSRLNRLIEDEIIQIVAVSNPLKIGYKAVGVLKIYVDLSKIEEVTAELQKLEAVWFIVQTTGNPDIYAEFITESTESLHDLLHTKIYPIEGINQVEATLILKYVKRTYNWGVAM
ncbi:MAG: Lrp/AsnC family transcriptional regulator [Desulfocapsaceae bacterium]|nr:Lrp/AsnC family transcriptional regulator [Desulfocapsaceae bacterium]